MFSINVKSKDTTLIIRISDYESYKKYQQFQHGYSLNSYRSKFPATGDFDKDVTTLYNNYWSMLINNKVYDDLPTNPTILDIGSGIGVIDFFAYQYLERCAKFYLLDGDLRTRVHGNPIYSSNSVDHGFYNNRSVSKDIINSSGFDSNDFVFLEPNDAKWPNIQFDMISSYASWCWHYNFETYWSRVKDHLKVGGKLITSISEYAEKESNIIETISKEFNSQPISIHTFDRVSPLSNAINKGYRCCWIRN
jgi:SAM-dependent methyltransferase